ncbi:MAG: class I SAM-dependent methyltransferase [Planctomycetota bacterium]|nr:class I SAM-dependent methyltransferase [Planctomycetota bacterium]
MSAATPPPAATNGAAHGNGEADAHESWLYNGLAKLYDPIFARVFYPRASRTIRALGIGQGHEVLELGVGTGLSLEAYPESCRVLGIDYSDAMLAQAHKKVRKKSLSHVSLRQMDAQDLSLPTGRFDFVMAFHIVTVVPDHERLMREAMRVCKPGGLITVINHFRDERGLVPRLEVKLDRTLRRLGWTTMTQRELLDPHGLEVLSVKKDWPQSLFTTIVLRNPA